VKNTPFVIKVTITNTLYQGAIWDFNRLTIDASLLYDCWEEKEVPYLKNKPIQYHGKVNDTADTMTLSTKINVLSSHCENMMFRVKLKAYDSRTNESLPSLTAISEPIKVISKPDQLPGKAKPAAPSTNGKARPKKRTNNDVTTESLEKIQEQQKEHHDLLKKLCEREGAATGANRSAAPSIGLAGFDELSLSSILREAEADAKATPAGVANPTEENALEKAFHNFVDVYNKLSTEQRPEKIRKIVRNASARKTDTFCEIVSLFNDEGLQKELGRECSLTFMPISDPSCSPDICPHKKELERIDEFYRDFLAVSPSCLGDDPLALSFSSHN